MLCVCESVENAAQKFMFYTSEIEETSEVRVIQVEMALIMIYENIKLNC